MRSRTLKYLIILFGLVTNLITVESQAQVCVPDIFFKHYLGNAAVYTYKVITTAQDDVIAAGSTLKLNGEFLDATDGWVSKLSPRGVVLWSKRYYVAGFNSGGFLSIENATDSTYLVTARFGKYRRKQNGSLEELDAATFLIHLDKFGTVIWMQRITNYINDSYLYTVTRLNDNSFLLAGNIINSAGIKLLALKINLQGTVLWQKLMFIDSTILGTPTAKQLNNGDLVLLGYMVKRVPGDLFSDQGYYFIKLDPNNGDLLRSGGIYVNRVPTTQYSGHDNIRQIIELPNDTLVLGSSFSESQLFGRSPGYKEAILIKTGLNGQFYEADAYYNTQPGCQLKDFTYKNGTYKLFLDDGYKPLYAELNRTGEIINQKAYGNAYSLLEGYKLLDRKPDNRVFFIGRGQTPLMGLMKTENDGSINCMETPSQMTTKSVSSFFSSGSVQISYINTSFPFAFEDFTGSLGWYSYTFNTSIDCILTCCDNIRSDTTFKETCAVSFRLPDNSIVRETGMYYVNTKNANNCDSIAYYDLRFSRKPVINLGEDTCIKNNTPIVLRSDPGYLNYNWMGVNTTNHTYTVRVPGKYRLSITNLCGTGVDEIEIYEDCEFPVYMPTAFTPGMDGLNDLYTYPGQNKNRFISLEIYNRYGQRVFFTNHKTSGWDGKYKKIEQPSGQYVYLLRLTTLEGRGLLKKGTFLLIRR